MTGRFDIDDMNDKELQHFVDVRKSIVPEKQYKCVRDKIIIRCENGDWEMHHGVIITIGGLDRCNNLVYYTDSFTPKNCGAEIDMTELTYHIMSYNMVEVN